MHASQSMDRWYGEVLYFLDVFGCHLSANEFLDDDCFLIGAALRFDGSTKRTTADFFHHLVVHIEILPTLHIRHRPVDNDDHIRTRSSL